MRKTLLLTLIAASATWVTAGASGTPKLEATFEGDAVTDGGWTEVHAGTKALWSVTQYSTDTQFKSGSLSVNKLGALKCAASKSGGLSVTGSVAPDNWLISPEVTVSAGDALNYMVAFAAGYNSSNVTSDAQRLRLDVLISTTTADTSAFTETIASELPREYKDWSWRSIDLSKYAGKKVRIAFRDHGSPIKNFVSQYVFLDNVSVEQGGKTDLAASAFGAFKNGTVTTQPVSVLVSNTGTAVSNHKVSYSIDGGAAVTETASQAIATGDTLRHTFAAPAVMEAGTHTIKAWTEADADAYTYNDTISTTVEVIESVPVPYKADASNVSSALATSYSSRSQGWTWMERYGSWVFTPATKASYLYTTKGISLKKGVNKVRFYGTVTSAAAVNVYLTQEKGDYTAQNVGKRSLQESLTPAWYSFNIDVPADGDYLVALGASTAGQIALSAFEVCEDYDDVQALSITEPASAMLTKSDVPVKVRVRNDGSKQASNVKVAYKVGAGAAVEETIASITPATEIEYTFSAKADLSKAGTHTITAWVSLKSDGDASNDTVAKQVYTYAPHEFPYSTSFETQADSLEWSCVNVDADETYWGVEATRGYTIDGNRTLYLNYMPTETHNDYAVSPAINLKSGQKGRVSFYYGLTTLYGGSKLQVLLSKDPSLEGLQNATKLTEIDIANKGYNYANAYFTVPDTDGGTYYFAIRAYGGKDQIFVDDFRVNADDELAIVGVTPSETGESYEPKPVRATVAVTNCSMNAVKGAQFNWTVTGTDADGKVVSTQNFTENYTGTINPGETQYIIFADSATITKPATYAVRVSMTSSADADTKNNTYQAEGPTMWTTLSAPALIGFENDTDNKPLQLGKKWTVSTYVPYDGKRSLAHSGKAQDEGGDWAFLNRVYLPAGTYDVSFFWKTMTNQAKATYAQNFSAWLGKEASAQAMSIKLAEVADTTNADHKATKELATVDINEPGYYFIGLNCTTINTLGYVVFDQFEIAQPAEGIAVTADSPYTADFSERESEWYHYHPSTTSNQWKATTTDGETCVSAERTYTDWMKQWKTPSLYEAPAFSLKQGTTYHVAYDYAITGTDAGNPLDGNSKLTLLLADKDVPAAFTTAVAEGTESYTNAEQSRSTATGTFTVPASGVYYLALQAESSVSAKFSLYSFKLSAEESTSVDDVAIHKTVAARYFYSMSGIRFTEKPVEAGVYVEQTVYTDGTTSATKLLVK